MNVRRVITIGMLSLIFPVLVGALVTVGQIRSIGDLQDEQEAVMNNLETSAYIDLGIAHQQSLHLLYASSGSAGYLDYYRNLQTSNRDYFATLSGLVADEARLAEVDAFGAEMEAYYTAFDQELVPAVETGDAAAIAAASELVSNAGAAADRSIIDITEAFAVDRRVVADELEAGVATGVRTVLIVSGAVLAVSALGALWAGRTITHVFSDTVDQVGAAADGLRSSSAQLQDRSSSTSDAVDQIAHRSSEASDRIDDFAQSIEHMSAAIKEISSNSSEASTVANDAVTQAERTNATVARLGESSAEIGQVIEVITSIAEQTNLLALNATIEAARAGEAGKGFAVVANEVKELAKQTSAATEQISERISGIQGDTSRSVDAIAAIGETIERISEIQANVAAAVEEQQVVTEQIGLTVRMASDELTELSREADGVKVNADTVHEIAERNRERALGLVDLQEVLRRRLGTRSPASGPIDDPTPPPAVVPTVTPA